MPSGDSISRYDSSMEMFSAAASPMQMKKAQSAKGTSGKDTLETPQARMERLNPVNQVSGDQRVPRDRIIKIARAGRFFFFAVALPPYLCMYILPKWMFTKVLPALLVPIEKGFLNSKRLFQNLARMLMERLPGLFRNPFGRIDWKARGVENQNASMLGYIRHRFVKIGQYTREVLRKGHEITAKIISKPFMVAKKKVEFTLKKLAEVVSKTSEKVVHLAKNTYDTVVQPLVNMIVPRVQTAKLYVEKGAKWAQNNIEQLVLRLQEAVKPTLKAVRSVAEAASVLVSTTVAQLTQQIIQIGQPAINLFIPTMQFLKKHLSFGLRWLGKKPKNSFWDLYGKAQKYIKAAVPIAEDVLEKSKSLIKGIFGWVFEPLKRFIHRWLPFLPWFFNLLKELFFKAWKAFVAKCRPIRLFLNKKVRGFFEFFLDQGRKLVKAPVAYLVELMRKGVNLIFQVLKIGAIIIIAIGLVFKYWVELLIQVSGDLEKKFSYTSQSNQ